MIINWIECNLPWNAPPLDLKLPDEDFRWDACPNIQDKILEKFGNSEYELNEKINRLYYSNVPNDLSLANNLIDELQEFINSLPEYKSWLDEQEKRFRQEYDAYEAESKKRALGTFPGQGLAVPGTLIELQDGTAHLIGTMTPQADVCGDFKMFDRNTIVKRYAVVFDFSPYKKVYNDLSDETL